MKHVHMNRLSLQFRLIEISYLYQGISCFFNKSLENLVDFQNYIVIKNILKTQNCNPAATREQTKKMLSKTVTFQALYFDKKTQCPNHMMASNEENKQKMLVYLEVISQSLFNDKEPSIFNINLVFFFSREVNIITGLDIIISLSRARYITVYINWLYLTTQGS